MKRADILSLFSQALSQTCSSHVKENRVNKKLLFFPGSSSPWPLLFQHWDHWHEGGTSRDEEKRIN